MNITDNDIFIVRMVLVFTMAALGVVFFMWMQSNHELKEAIENKGCGAIIRGQCRVLQINISEYNGSGIDLTIPFKTPAPTIHVISVINSSVVE